MPSIHLILAWAAVGAALMLVLVAVLVATGRVSYRHLDAAILAQLATTGAAALVGLALPLTGSTLRDTLHVLYAVVALLAAPAARYTGRSEARRMGRYAVVAGLIILGTLLRLFMTAAE